MKWCRASSSPMASPGPTTPGEHTCSPAGKSGEWLWSCRWGWAVLSCLELNCVTLQGLPCPKGATLYFLKCCKHKQAENNCLSHPKERRGGEKVSSSPMCKVIWEAADHACHQAKRNLILQIFVTQSLVLGPAASASSGNSLERDISRPCPRIC